MPHRRRSRQMCFEILHRHGLPLGIPCAVIRLKRLNVPPLNEAGA
jgi:hypothetical protein